MKNKIINIAVASLTGLIFHYLNIPAGALVGSLIATAVMQMYMNESLVVPRKVKRFIRIIMGTYIGLGITLEGIINIRGIWGAVLIDVLGMLTIASVAAIVLYKVFNWDLITSFLSAMPAGLTEVGMNAEELDADPVQVTIIHLVRVISVIVTVPIILKLLT